MVDYFKIGPDDTQIGAVIFSDDASLQFRLNQHQDPLSLKSAILGMQCIGQTTNTPEAIRTTRAQCFDPQNGDRPDIQNLAIIVTDGVPYPPERREPAFRQAQILRSTGARLVAIGITDEVDRDVLRQLSSLPQEENKNYFMSPTFTVLNEISRSVFEESCVVGPFGRHLCFMQILNRKRLRARLIYLHCLIQIYSFQNAK